MGTCNDPRRCTAPELKKVGGTLESLRPLLLRCDQCGRRWSPLIRSRGKLPVKTYWRCPHQCNDPEKRSAVPSGEALAQSVEGLYARANQFSQRAEGLQVQTEALARAVKAAYQHAGDPEEVGRAVPQAWGAAGRETQAACDWLTQDMLEFLVELQRWVAGLGIRTRR